MGVELEPITFKGDKKKWSKFTKEVKKNHDKVWRLLNKCIDCYLKNSGCLKDQR